MLAPDLEKPDQAYPEMMKLVPQGLLGLSFAALVAAIASSLGSMCNSISTIFTMDIYAQVIDKNVTEKKKVFIGRSVALASMIIAIIFAKPLLGSLDQAFQYIQEFTGFFTPGVVAIFLMGLFWKRANGNAALAAALGSAILSAFMFFVFPDFPFMNRVGLVFVLCVVIGVAVSYLTAKPAPEKAIALKDVSFDTTTSFNVLGFGVLAILVALYATWW